MTLLNMTRVFRCSVFLLLFVNTVFSQSKVGTSAAQFLGISVGPKALAMGSAYAASSNDVTSLYWNPGAFVQANKTEFLFSNTNWLVDTKFRWFGFMYNLDGQNAFGVSLTQLDYGEEEVTTVDQPEGTGERWSAQDLAVAASYSRRFTDRFSLGGSAKFINQRVFNEVATGVTFDLGLLFITEFNNIRLGMSMSNFGGDLQLDGHDLLVQVPGSNNSGKLKTDAWPTPLFFRVGVAMDVVRTNDIGMTLAADWLRPNDNAASVNVGGEVGWRDLVFVRGGYKSIGLESSEEGLSLGAGIKYTAANVGSLQIDYAFNKFGIFDNLNTIGVSIAF
jgi:hypothetical protein